MRSLLPLLFLLIFRGALCVPVYLKLDPCIGNFCLFKPIADRQFVERFGPGSVRFDKDDHSVLFRCFYLKNSKTWVEFQFGSHTSELPKLMSVFVSGSKLCSDSFLPRALLDASFERGKIFMGMSESQLVMKMGQPARVELLSGNHKNSIYDKRFGDRAFVYETDDSVLYGVLYIGNSKVVGYRLSVEE